MNRSYPLTRLNRRLVSEHISNMVCGPAILAVLAASVLVLHIIPETVSPPFADCSRHAHFTKLTSVPSGYRLPSSHSD